MTLTVARPKGKSLWLWALATPTVLAVAVVVAVTLAGGSAVYRELDRGVPGELTSVTSAVLGFVSIVGSTVCVGGLFHASFLHADIGRRRLLVDVADLVFVRIGAVLWGSAAVLLVAVDAADSNGQPLSKLVQPGALGYLFQASYAPSAWLLTAGCAFVVFVAAVLLQRWQTSVLTLAISLLGVLSPVLVATVLVGPNHDFGSDATIIGLPALTIWFGSTAIMAVKMLRGRAPGAAMLRRYFRVSAVCWMIVAGQGVVVALFETAGTPIWSTPTGIMFIGQFTIMGALALTGIWGMRSFRRRPRLPALAATAAVASSVALMTLYLGVTEAMTRVPAPVFFVPTSIMDLFFGYNVDSAPTLTTMLADWRINILFFVPAVAAMALYLVGVIRLRRRGDRWSPARTATWMLGCLVVILTTSSALGPYASASFSIHMIFHMSLNMLGPLLLVMGGPVTLALRATQAHNSAQPAGPHEWINAMMHWSLTTKLYNPLLVFVEFISSYYVIYFTNLFDWAMRYHWAHQLMNLHFLIIGYLFYSLVIGVDRPPRPLPHIGKLGLVLAAMPFHAFFGVIVFTSSTVIGNLFYHYIDVPWMHDLHWDQVVGGGIAWAAGELPLVVVVVALVAQWAKQDRREATQQDRHIDQGLDDSYEAYNQMLADLEHRIPAQQAHSSGSSTTR